MPVPALPAPVRTESRRPDHDREADAAVQPAGAGAPLRVEQLLEERARIEQLYEQARTMNFSDGRADVERVAQVAEEALERQVRELPGSEQRELQDRERVRGLDRGGPSR